MSRPAQSPRRAPGIAAAALAAGIALQALAVPAGGDDAGLDARTHALAEQLRCMVCQNQTLADSNAELAVDLRNQIRAQLRDGASEAQIRDYLVSRYGDFVLYKPPLKPSTWALWFGPGVLLAGVAVGLRKWVAGRAGSRDTTACLAASPDDDLAPDEQARLASLLGPPREPPR